MTYSKTKKPDYLSDGKMARLFPTDKSAERRATSVLLATMMSVEEFGKNLLRDIGATYNSRSKIECFTEIAFKESFGVEKSNYPDGLIVITTGSKTWRALVEAKIDDNKQDKQQIENYLELAKKHDIQALITISNQYVSCQTLQPNSIQGINKKKTKDKLFHWSWAYLLSEAMVWIKEHKRQERNIADADQRYILQEFVRFCDDSASGIVYQYGNMGKEWQKACKSFQGSPTTCTDEEIADAVSSWQKLVRSLALQLGMKLGEPVSVLIGRKHKQDPFSRLQDNQKRIKEKKNLIESLKIPNASSSLAIIVDVKARTVRFSMDVDATQEKLTAKGIVNDFLHMVKCEDENLFIEAVMARKANNVIVNMKDIKTTKGEALYSQCVDLPRQFRVVKAIDMNSGTFNSPRAKFSEEIFKELAKYYNDIGQHLVNRIPPASKMEQDNTIDDNNIKGEIND